MYGGLSPELSIAESKLSISESAGKLRTNVAFNRFSLEDVAGDNTMDRSARQFSARQMPWGYACFRAGIVLLK